MMKTSKADWISQWGRAYQVETRLRQAFATARGRKLLKWFEAKKLDPDVLAFALIVLVWPVQAARKVPSPAIWRDGVQWCRQAAQWLRAYGTACHLFDVEKITRELEQYAGILEREQMMVSVGNVTVGLSLPFVKSRSRRDVAKQHALALLTGYFKSLPDDRHAKYAEHPPWEPITDFLVVAELISADRTPQKVASVWATAMKRNRDAMQTFPDYQAELLTIFAMMKDTLKKQNADRDYPSTFRRVLARLRRYADG